MSVVNTIYFSHDEMKNILEHYGKVIRDNNYPFKEKISYEGYRRMYGCPNGIMIMEDDKGTLWYYDAAFEYSEPAYATDRAGNKLLRIREEKQPLILATKPGFDFHDFFFAYYLCHHSDYRPQKEKEEDKEMAKFTSNITDCTLTWDNNTATSNSSLAYNSTANREYDCVWTTTPNYVTNTWTDARDTWSITLDDVNIGETLKELADAAQTTAGAIGGIGTEIKKLNDKNEKENKKMKGFNFDFGPCTTDNVRMSMYGIAVKNQANEWVSYNPTTAQIVNVDIFNFEGGKYMFKMPVAPSQVAKGDVIIHNKKAMFVLDMDDNGFIVVDPHAGEEKKVVPTSNCFGFNFITKVVSMFDAFAAAPNTDAPFGNMLPFMMMDSDSKDFDPMMMMFMMNQNGNMGDMFNNPMMMYFMLKDKGNDNMLPLMMMMSQTQAPKGKNGK